MKIEVELRTASGPTPKAASAFLTLAKLAGSLILIIALAGLIGTMLACAAAMITAATQGREGTAELLQRLQFDAPLRTRVGSGIIGVLYLGLAAATLFVARVSGKDGWRKRLAVGRSKPLDLVAFATMALTIIYGAGVSFLLARLQDRHLTVSGPTDLLLIGLVVTNLCILAPIAEELLFRGWLYTGLHLRFGVVPSFVITALLFAAYHWNRRHVMLVIPLALALGALRVITGSIRPTIATHCAYNLCGIVITLANL